MYLQGAEVEAKQPPVKDEVKALSWFLKASNRGYFESTVNAIQILSKGTACGTIPANKIAAKLLLTKAKKSRPNAKIERIEKLVDSIGQTTS